MVTVIHRHGPEVFQISDARKSLSEDVRGRERRYVISMLVRTASVLLTVVLWNVSRPLAVGLLVLGVALPYVAVVIANAGRENAPVLPSALLEAPAKPRLEESRSSSAHDGPRPSASSDESGSPGVAGRAPEEGGHSATR